MKRALINEDPPVALWWMSDGRKVEGMNRDMRGDCSGLRGDCSGLGGECSGLKGLCTGITGDCSHLVGNFDQCELLQKDRDNGVDIRELTV